MKEYMVVTLLEGVQRAYFYDRAHIADIFKSQVEAQGGYAQIYRLLQISDLSTGTPMWKEYQFVTD